MKVTLQKITREIKGLSIALASAVLCVVSPFSGYAETNETIPVTVTNEVLVEEISENTVDNTVTIEDSGNDFVVIDVTNGNDHGPGFITEDVVEECSVPLTDEPVSTTPTLFLNLTPTEKEILCRIVEAEVTGTSYKGAYGQEMIMSKFRVARVVINRVLDGRFPNSIEGVVYQKGQFTPIRDGRFWKVQITDMTRQAVEMALNPAIPDDIPGALYFNSKSGHRSKRLQLLVTDAVGHKFYCYK